MMRFHAAYARPRRKSESQKAEKTDTGVGKSPNKNDERKALQNNVSVQRAMGLRRKFHKKSMLRKQSTDGAKVYDKVMRRLQQMSSALERSETLERDFERDLNDLLGKLQCVDFEVVKERAKGQFPSKN
ncbi:unnamed protein product [Pocillopora meandrina]|uniref:BZIP domain-containing protein n=1 Tax=Pocillopora meandrina TaxID=46732 RepID=A0AAU9XQ72_9CNID|nr:unnamed protein product [Pocillopora meandrina]